MDQIIEQMLKQYGTQTTYDKRNSIKEVVQEIVLCGLSRSGFFKKAAFYGGTALRMFYGLDRFSEDLDFSLKAPDPFFTLDDYLPILEKEVRSYGLNFRVEMKAKNADSGIRSAFLKGNTKEHILMFFADEQFVRSIAPGEIIKVKFEVDINPPNHAAFESMYRLLPIPYEIMLYDMPSLFAGKIHAVICRAWKNRIKGRDLYDYVFYRSRGTEVNLKHLTARLEQSGYNISQEQITIEDIKNILRMRFKDIDYEQAKQDILPFIKNPGAIDVWKAEFFSEITEGLKQLSNNSVK